MSDYLIKPQTGANLINMNAKFLSFRHRTDAVTTDEVTEFEQWFKGAKVDLPEPPSDEDE